jgi:glycosyltransferase involved in cell wall biosynthesis
MTAAPAATAGDRAMPGIRVVMAGPLPPAVGGMATVIGDISQSTLAEQVQLVLFDTKKQTAENRPLWQGVAARLRLWRQWWRAVGGGGVIAHIHTCSGLSYFLDGTLLLLARVRGVPVVLHVHGANFDKFLDALPGVGRWLARWLARRAARIVVLSEEWRANLAQRLPGAHLAVIVNGVPIPEARTQAPDDDGATSILFLGNLGKRKGVWDLLEAAEQLPDTARLILVGGEEEPGIAKEFVAALGRRHLESKVEYAGPAFGAEKHQWLARARIFVLPSYAEGLPISLLEAMAAGLPVVVTPVGGIPTVIRDGEEGLLVQPGDVAGLASALNRLLEDAGLRQRLGNAARARCTERFGIENVARAYLDLYRGILAG